MRSQLFVAVLLVVLSCVSAGWITRHLNSARIRPAAAQVGNKVYIAGGEIDNLVETDSIEVFNLDTLELEESNLTLNTLRQQFTATVVGTNIYYIGGFYHEPTIIVYDYLTFNFTRLPRAPWAVDVKRIEFMNDNKTIYVFAPNTLDIYDRVTNTWTTNQNYRSIVTKLYSFGFGVADKKAYIVGGYNATTTKLSSDVFVFDLVTGTTTKIENQILPQYFVNDMALNSSNTALLMTGGFNGNSANQIVNVYNKQTQNWFTTDLNALSPSSNAVSKGAVTDFHAYVVVDTANQTPGNGKVMIITLDTLVSNVTALSDMSGRFFGITATSTHAFIFGIGTNGLMRIFDQNAAPVSSTAVAPLSSYDITRFIPWGPSICFVVPSSNTLSSVVGCFSSAGLGATPNLGSVFADAAIVNDVLYVYDVNGGNGHFAVYTSFTFDSPISGPVIGIFDDNVVTTSSVYLVGSNAVLGTVGGDVITSGASVIRRRASLPNNLHVLSLDPNSVIVYPSTVEVLNTVNNTWSEFDLPIIATDNVVFGGVLNDYLALTCISKAYFIDTTTNELSNTSVLFSTALPVSIRAHMQMPVYNNRLITGIYNGMSFLNATLSSPLPPRSESNPIVSHLLLYDNKLFVADASANQFYFFVLNQNRWDARLLSGRRRAYAIAAVDSKVFIVGGRTDVIGTFGVINTDYTFYFEFNTATSSLSQQLNITYPRSEITPISTPDAAIFIGGKSFFGTYFDLIEIYTNRTIIVPVEPVTPNSEPGAPTGVDPGTIAGAVVGSVVGAAGIFLLVFFLLRAKKKREKKAQRMATIRTTVNLDDAIAKHPMYTPFAEIKFGKMLGSGANGQVFLGRWKSTDVALKVSMSQANEGFIQEVNLMLGLRPHPNVVRIFGFSIHPETQNVILILEFCDGGSLDNILFDDPNELPMPKKLAWIQGIARGVLHLQSNNIVHRDLAARNVLLHRGEAKITDFGMSRVVDEGKKGTTTSDIGPIRWMAPESIANKEYSTKSDVWSFAIIMYEILSRQEPHVAGDPLEIAVRIRDHGDTPGIPEDCPEALATIMQRCWAKAPQDRPTFQEITDYLDKVKL